MATGHFGRRLMLRTSRHARTGVLLRVQDPRASESAAEDPVMLHNEGRASGNHHHVTGRPGGNCHLRAVNRVLSAVVKV